MRRWILGLMTALSLTLCAPAPQAEARDLYQVGDMWIWIGSDWGPPPAPPPPGTRWLWTGLVWVSLPGV